MPREPDEITARRQALGERLAAFRQAAELTQGQLARRAFCDRTTIAHIEKGRRPADERFWRTVDDICQAEGALLTEFVELEAAKHAVINAMSYPLRVVVLLVRAVSRTRMTRTVSVRQVPYHRQTCSATCTVLAAP